MQRLIYIHSDNRDSGVVEDFTINDSGQRFANFQPLYAEIKSVFLPFSWYNVTTSNNSVLFRDTSGSYLVMIESGYYTPAELASALATSINALSSLTYTVEFLSAQLRYQFSTTANFTLDFTVSNNLATLLGFPVAVTPSAGVQTSSRAGSEPREIFICSDLAGGIDNGLSILQSSTASEDQILGVVPVTGTFGQYFSYEFPPNLLSVGQSKFSSNGQVRFFLSASGFDLDLNGFSWSVVLKLYAREPYKN